MNLNPSRAALAHAGLRAFGSETPFRPEADAALSAFRVRRADLERQVRRGDLTPRVARETAAAEAARLRDDLRARAESFHAAPRAFLDRLIEASEARRHALENQSLEGLQRETNRLMRQLLVEQQLVHRSEEFEGRAFVRSMSGGAPAPTLDSLLAFHDQAAQAGDDSASEWARRQLESFRSKTINPDDQTRIDLACDRPDRLNERLVARYVEALRDFDADSRERFVSEAIGSRDANACVSAFLLAREAPEGASARWVRQVIDGLRDFPDSALTALRAWEADARRSETAAALSAAEYASALAEAEARFPGLQAPSDADLARRSRIASRPLAAPDEPVGLSLSKRGRLPDDPAPAEPTVA
jgi:hypothetical protein